MAAVTLAAASAIAADDAAPKPAVPAAAAAPAAKANPDKKLTPEETAEYARLTRQELQLTAERSLLTRLSQEHLERAEQLAGNRQPDKAQWEKDLANELQARSSALLIQLNEVTRQRVTFEAAHPPSGPAPLGSLGEKKALNADEFAYVAGLDERLLKIRQELALSLERARDLQAELQTNHTEEAVGRVSFLLEDNQRLVRDCEKEQANLELKKLEFRALRK